MQGLVICLGFLPDEVHSVIYVSQTLGVIHRLLDILKVPLNQRSLKMLSFERFPNNTIHLQLTQILGGIGGQGLRVESQCLDRQQFWYYLSSLESSCPAFFFFFLIHIYMYFIFILSFANRGVCARVPDGFPDRSRKPSHFWRYASLGVQGEAKTKIPRSMERKQPGEMEHLEISDL